MRHLLARLCTGVFLFVFVEQNQQVSAERAITEERAQHVVPLRGSLAANSCEKAEFAEDQRGDVDGLIVFH